MLGRRGKRSFRESIERNAVAYREKQIVSIESLILSMLKRRTRCLHMYHYIFFIVYSGEEIVFVILIPTINIKDIALCFKGCNSEILFLRYLVCLKYIHGKLAQFY